MLTAHPFREALHNEVHARPYEQMVAPFTLTHLALLTPEPKASREHLHRRNIFERKHGRDKRDDEE